jgi:hypothetical protein
MKKASYFYDAFFLLKPVPITIPATKKYPLTGIDL